MYIKYYRLFFTHDIQIKTVATLHATDYSNNCTTDYKNLLTNQGIFNLA